MFRPVISVLGTILAVALVLVARTAAARPVSPGDRARAEAAFAEAERADAAFELARALALYDESRAIDPASARAPKAEARAAVLRAHAEGGFAPFVELERMRRDPALAADASAIDRLVADAETFPPGLTQVEVWVLAAEAYQYRLGRPGDAERLYARVMTAERADPIIAKKAARDLVTMQLGRGDLAAAQATVASAGARADDKLARDVARVVRRRQAHVISIAVLTIVATLAAWAVARAMRGGASGRASIAAAVSKTSRIAVVYAVYVAVSGAVLASRYEEGTGAPFLVLGIVLVPLLLVARAWGAAGARGATARAGRAVACAASAMAAAFLVLETINASFLEGMGL